MPKQKCHKNHDNSEPKNLPLSFFACPNVPTSTNSMQIGVVKKVRDSRGNLLKVSNKALFGKKKEIEKRIQKLGIGQKINTSHMRWRCI